MNNAKRFRKKPVEIEAWRVPNWDPDDVDEKAIRRHPTKEAA